MGTIIGTAFAFALVFGILVFVHEFGHFFMAKLVNIRVEVFSWGYGKRLLGIKKGDTDYRISVLPLGGYVRFTGEEDYEEKKERDPREFMAKKRWQRFLVMVMGSVMNILLAVVILAGMNMVGVNVPEYQQKKPVIGWIMPDSPAERANLQVDDEILRINGKQTETWEDVELAVGTRPERLITLEIERGQEIKEIEIQTESVTQYEMGYAGFLAKILTQIDLVLPNSPAEKAGLQPGDVVLAIDGKPVFLPRFTETIQKNPEKELDFLVRRGDRTLNIEVTPRKEGDIGVIGVQNGAKSVVKKYGFFSAIVQSVKDNAKLAFLVVNFIKDLITGEASAKQLGGPIAIANFSYAAFRMGLMAMAGLIAFISLQLGIINLFPIPALDGGQILVLGLEGLFRRDFSSKVKQIIIQIGFFILVVIMIFAVLNDVVKRLPNGWESLIPF